MSDLSFLDGNAAAGELREIFAFDVTTATGQCASCAHVGPLAEGHVYAFTPGIVVRCAGCEQPLLRLVKDAGRVWIDMRGLVYLQV
jgi:hypothetical protein